LLKRHGSAGYREFQQRTFSPFMMIYQDGWKASFSLFGNNERRRFAGMPLTTQKKVDFDLLSDMVFFSLIVFWKVNDI
jgi:hypothetical protein